MENDKTLLHNDKKQANKAKIIKNRGFRIIKEFAKRFNK